MKTGLPARALRIVPYLTPEEIQQLCAACRGRHRDRDALLILVLFQTGLRISEALSLTVGYLSRQPGALEVLGKGSKVRLVACPAPLVHRLKAYAFDRGLGPAGRLFPVGRKRAWQIIGAAAAHAGLGKRVYLHLCRHSGAIERRRQTGQPPGLAAAPGPCQPAHDHAVSVHHHGRGDPAHQSDCPVRGLRRTSTARGRPPIRQGRSQPFSPPSPPEALPPVLLYRQRAPPDRQRHHHLRPGHLQRRRGGLRRRSHQGLPHRPGRPRSFRLLHTTHTMPVKANEAIRDDYCRRFTTRERNCEGAVWAQC